MKAIVYKNYGPPEVLKPEEIEKPIPKDNEVLIKVIATSVTVADVRMRAFNVPRSVWLPARIALGIRGPRNTILGVEFAGEIESTGKSVKHFKKGNQVFGESLKKFGAYAEYLCLPENGLIAIKPSNITFEEAAAISVGARTALHYLRKAKIRKDQKVLIFGASGSVGTYAVQLAKHFGAHVTGVCSTANLRLVEDLGADEVIDYTKEDFTKNGQKYDAILVAVNKISFNDCAKSLAENGTYMNVTEPFPNLKMIQKKLAGHIKIVMGQSPPNDPETLEYLKNLINEGKLKVVIDRQYQMEDIVEAHRYVDQGHKKGNVVVKV